MSSPSPFSSVTLERIAALPLPDRATPSSSLHFGLIVPPSPFVVPAGWEWVHSAPFEGPSIIAGLIKGLGYRFTLLDQRDLVDPEDLRGKLKDFDVIGFSTWGDSFNYVKRAAVIAKEERPDAPIVFGGPLITSAPRLIMENTAADYAILGEGELSLTELMDFIVGNRYARPIADIEGLAWKNPTGTVVINASRAQITQLDAIPFQDLSVWDRFRGGSIPEVYLSYSRGCIANCTFCSRAFPKLNAKSVERVRRELEYYKPYGFRMAWWNDLTFVTDKEYVHKLMDEALPAHDFRWTAFSRVTGIDVPVLQHMKDRGLDLVLYGMESVSKEILVNYHKGISRNAIVNAIHTTREANVKAGGLFIIGAPHDTRKTAQELIDFCEEFKEVTRVKYLSAIPGTQDYKAFVKSGKIRDELAHLDWLSREQSIEEDIDQEGFIVFADKMTKEELKEVYRKVNNTIERRPYNYMNPQNEFLPEPTAKFVLRPMIPANRDIPATP